MKIYIYPVVGCILILLIQCSTPKVIGNYISNNSNNSMNLKNDGTFEAQINDHMIYRRTKGIWKKSGNTISLKSLDSFRYFNVIEKDSTNLKNIIFIIDSPNGYEALGCYILLNEDTSRKYYFRENGVVIVPKDSNNFNSIVIHSPTRYEHYNRRGMKSDFFYISFDNNNNNNNSKWYIDEKYLIKGQKLFSTEYEDFFFYRAK